MKSARRLIALLAAVGALGLVLTACGPQVPGFDSLTRIVFWAGSTVPPEAEQHRQDDPEQIAEFVALLREHGIDTSSYQTPPEDTCPAGDAFRVEGTYGDTGYGFGMDVRDCGDADDSFEAEATDLLAGWLDELER